MKNTNKKSITLALAAVLGLGLVSSNANAQGWRGSSSSQWGNGGYGQSSRGYGNVRDQSGSLKRDASTLDQLADQMTAQFARDMRSNRGCRESIALFNHMRTYAYSTDSLVRASNGTCPITFKKAAREVRNSLTCVQNQAKRVPNLSCCVKDLIAQSCPIATRVLNDSDRFSSPSSFSNTPTYNSPRGGRGSVAAGRGVRGYEDPFTSLLTSFLRAIN